MLFDNELPFHKYESIAGIDEAGRGPLAGPVVVGAVILDKKIRIDGLDDSKKLSAKKRENLYGLITSSAICWQVSIVEPQIIDELNILQATLLGMEQAVRSLEFKPDICLIDGNIVPESLKSFSQAMIKGDAKYVSIAAASILAKVTRDRIMKEMHSKYPVYNFYKNKGYPTKEHISAINRYGITPLHRKSFKPVREIAFKF